MHMHRFVVNNDNQDKAGERKLDVTKRAGTAYAFSLQKLFVICVSVRCVNEKSVWHSNCSHFWYLHASNMCMLEMSGLACT